MKKLYCNGKGGFCHHYTGGKGVRCGNKNCPYLDGSGSVLVDVPKKTSGCPFCNGEQTFFGKDSVHGLSVEFDNKGTHIVAFHKDNDGNPTAVRIKIEYCPKCGKKL